ncbi:MAG: hypothetical protein SD837_10765 [Candidatus Electrothrix scaldis]|nr:MAG: hypothetical protein SD837_10765 [Candidatus Electrothrix sp. GW3-3]
MEKEDIEKELKGLPTQWIAAFSARLSVQLLPALGMLHIPVDTFPESYS